MLIPDPVVAMLCAGTATAAVTLTLSLTSRRQTVLARRNAQREAALAQALLAELRHLAETRFPTMIRHRVHPYQGTPPLLHAQFAGTDVAKLHDSLLDQALHAIADEQVRVDESAQAVLRSTAARSRTLATQVQRLLIAAQDQFADDARVTAVLYEMDHLNEQIKGLWQLMAVVCGDSTGLSRQDSYLEDLVVTAQSRIETYQVIKPANHLPAGHRIGVAAHAAEPVAVVLSALLANAAFYSTSSVPVHVEIHQTANGAAMSISDAGPGISDARDLAYATRMLSGQHRVLLSDLGPTPRLGLAGISRLVRTQPITVSLGRSEYGGVQAVVHLDASLLVRMDPSTQRASVAAPVPVEALRSGERALPPDAVSPRCPDSLTPGGLPQRRRLEPDAPSVFEAPPSRDNAKTARDPQAVRERYADLQFRVRQARDGLT